jgi:hypothetical protein
MSLSERNIKSKISISQYANKIYIDPFYGIPMPKAAVNYSIFSSRWDIEEVNEDNILKIIHRESGDSISLSFNTYEDKIEFVKNIYANKTIKQIGTNNRLEKLANRNIKPQKDNYLNSVLKRIINNFKTSESIN